ncbi:carbohydrate kinase [Candidatus Gottesmanbacteria bacterium]|nr:carbohydrate kinase [Candidatus Gottesmanbacteria bacterium]
MKIITLGEFLIDMIKTGEEPEILAEKFLALPGGAPANVAVGLARLGTPCGFIGCVGNDSFGHRLISHLEKYGVDVSGVKEINDIRTTQAYIFPRPDGKKDIFFYRNPGADQMLGPLDIKEEYFAKIRFFHHGSISMIERNPFLATLKAIKLTKKNKGLISFDPNYRPAIWPNPKLALNRIYQGFKYADIIKTSNEDLPFISGDTNIRRGARKILKSSNALIIVVTLAQSGCYYLTKNGQEGNVPGFKVNVVEVTGAGDAFSASMLFDLLPFTNREINNLSKFAWEKILVRANAAGALACTKQGAIPAMPTKMEVDAFLAKNQPVA